MKKGRTLQELAAELHRQNSAKRDFIVNTGAVGLSATADSVTLTKMDGCGSEPLSEDFRMTDLFHRQMGSALGIPAKY